MDPITIITTALVFGISVGLKNVSEQLVKDAYLGLKTLVVDRYKVSLDALENNPSSELQAAAVAEQLTNNKVDQDQEIVQIAQKLLEKAGQDENGKNELSKIKITLNQNKKFAFSVSGPATYNEK